MRLMAYNAVTKEGKVENNQCPQGAESAGGLLGIPDRFDRDRDHEPRGQGR